MGILDETDHDAHDFAVAEKAASDRRVQEVAATHAAAEEAKQAQELADARLELVTILIVRARASYRAGGVATSSITLEFKRNRVGILAPLVKVFDTYSNPSSRDLATAQLVLINDLLHIKDDDFGISYRYDVEDIIDPHDGLVGHKEVGVTFSISPQSVGEKS